MKYEMSVTFLYDHFIVFFLNQGAFYENFPVNFCLFHIILKLCDDYKSS